MYPQRVVTGDYGDICKNKSQQADKKDCKVSNSLQLAQNDPGFGSGPGLSKSALTEKRQNVQSTPPSSASLRVALRWQLEKLNQDGLEHVDRLHERSHQIRVLTYLALVFNFLATLLYPFYFTLTRAT